MRILHVAKKFPRLIGGDATAVAALASIQRRAGHEVFIATSNARDVEEGPMVFRVGPPQDAFDLDRITVRRVRAIAAVRRWSRRHFSRIRPEVVHAHAPDLGFGVAAEAHRRTTPIVDTCHGLWFPTWGASSLRGRAELALLRMARYDAIAAVDLTAERALKSQGFPRVVHIPNGVDPLEFAGPHVDPDLPTFLFAGRHESQKGLPYLVRAAARLRRERGPRFRIVLVGEGSLTPELRRQVHELGLDDVVAFAGRLRERADVVRAYLGASAFVLPSLYEGFPIALLEAWAAGLPVIATAVGGVAEVCTDENAIVVPPMDDVALAGAMAALLEDPHRGRRLGDAGRRLVRQRFSWDAVAARYMDLYLGAGSAG